MHKLLIRVDHRSQCTLIINNQQSLIITFSGFRSGCKKRETYSLFHGELIVNIMSERNPIPSCVSEVRSLIIVVREPRCITVLLMWPVCVHRTLLHASNEWSWIETRSLNRGRLLCLRVESFNSTRERGSTAAADAFAVKEREHRYSTVRD